MVKIVTLPDPVPEVHGKGLHVSFDLGTSHEILKNRVQMRIPNQMPGGALL